MVSRYNEQARNQGLTSSEMIATVGDLLGPAGPSAHLCRDEFFKFDLAAVGLGLHHFEDPDLAIRRLVERLKVGPGVLLVIDFMVHEHVQNGGLDEHVAHDRFAEGRMVELMSQNGCDQVKFSIIGDGFISVYGGEKLPRSIFMCRGTRMR